MKQTESMPSGFARQRSSWPMVGLVVVLAAVPICVVVLLHLWKGIPYGDLTRDPTAIFGTPPHTGFLSQLGIWLWSAAAAVCIFCAGVLSGRRDTLNLKRLLFVSGLLTLLLGFDDAFLFNEEVFPFLGVPEKVVLVSYAGFTLAFLARFRSTILKTEYSLLGMALAFFAVSMALDFLNPAGVEPHIVEEGAKFAGIVSWLAYFVRVGASAVSHHNSQQGAGPAG